MTAITVRRSDGSPVNVRLASDVGLARQYSEAAGASSSFATTEANRAEAAALLVEQRDFANQQTAITYDRIRTQLDNVRNRIEGLPEKPVPVSAFPDLRLGTGGAIPRIDWIPGKLWWAGRHYASEEAFLSAVSGSFPVAGGLEFGKIPVLPFNIVDPDNNDYTDWVVFGTGTAAKVGDQYRLTYGTGNSSASVTITATVRKAMEMRFDLQQVSGAVTAAPVWSSAGPDLRTVTPATGTASASATPVATSTVIPFPVGTMYGGFRSTLGASAGRITGIENFSVREVGPYDGWRSGAFSVVVDGRTPNQVTGLYVAQSADCGFIADQSRLDWIADTGMFNLKVRSDNAFRINGASGLDGPVAVAANTFFRAGYILDNAVRVFVNGVAGTRVTGVSYNAAAYMRLFKNLIAGNLFGDVKAAGTRLTVFDTETVKLMEHHTLPDAGIASVGDSFPSSATDGGKTLTAHIADALGTSGVVLGQGGTLLTDRAQFYTGDDFPMHGRKLFVQDGGRSGVRESDGISVKITIPELVAALAKIVAGKGDDQWVYALPVEPPSINDGGWRSVVGAEVASPLSPDLVEIYEPGGLKDQLLALYGAAHILDPLEYAQEPAVYAALSAQDKADVDAGYTPRSWFHVESNGFTLVHHSNAARLLLAVNKYAPAMAAL